MHNERLVAVLREAFQIEVEGAIFYRGVVGSIASPEARDIFVYLAEQEELHRRYLGEQAGRLAGGGALDLAALRGMSAGGREAVFAEAMRRAGELTQNEASALHTGILLEKSSIDYYTRAAAAAVDPAEVELLTTLIAWEQVHLSTLEDAYGVVKERIWADNRFAPF
jgi:rubrerythrin